MTKKKCAQCQEVKPRTDYYKNGTTPDGLQSKCKKCWYLFQPRVQATLRRREIDRKKAADAQSRKLLKEAAG